MRNEFEDNERYDPDVREVYLRFGYRVGKVECICILLAFSIAFRLVAYLALRLTISKTQ